MERQRPSSSRFSIFSTLFALACAVPLALLVRVTGWGIPGLALAPIAMALGGGVTVVLYRLGCLKA